MTTAPHIPADDLTSLRRILPFAMSFLLVPLLWLSAWLGGGWVLLTLFATWYLFSGLDAVLGLDLENADPLTAEDDLRGYRLIVMLWAPVQIATIFGLIAYATRADHLSGWATLGLFLSLGIVTGTVGINYCHELMHQKNRLERWLADILAASVLYSHFRSEHLLIHHRYVGTPGDPVTARRGESFYRYYPRVLYQSFRSAFRAEREKLAKKGLPWHDLSNPFWRYWSLQLAMLVAAVLAGGWLGLGLFFVQAGTAIFQLELINYIEHYGLTRKHLGEGRYEHVQPRHSWNAAQKASNRLLINLQRHSDHHYKPDRRFPLLQTYTEADAPQLPHGYPIMGMVAMLPPLWRRMMHPRIARWRQMYYPEITDWSPYNRRETPMPR